MQRTSAMIAEGEEIMPENSQIILQEKNRLIREKLLKWLRQPVKQCRFAEPELHSRCHTGKTVSGGIAENRSAHHWPAAYGTA